MDGLQGKIIIVAGGALGIGAACAHKLARHGATVIVADLNETDAKATAQSIVDQGGSAKAVRFDITDDASVRDLIDGTVREFGRLDGLHNNVADIAILKKDTHLIELEPDVWDRTINIDLKGFYTTMRHAVPHMLKQGGGSIVNTASASAFCGEPIRPAYGAAKAGVVALTKHVATAYGRQGVRCNAVAPGAVATENVLALTASMDGDAEVWFAHVRENFAHSHRDGKPQDIAAVVALMMSEEGSWINGQCFNVDGGWVLR